MNIMFMGTPEFAIPSLEALYNYNKCNVTSVVTNPDKPKGRGHKMAHSPIFETADAHNTVIYQPQNLKKENFEEILCKESPDMIVVVAFGMLLPKYVLDFPKYGCINVHGSLLPKYRGAAPMQWCVINGEKKTGITTMYMDKGLDTGDMLLKSETDILCDDTFETVHNKLMVLGAELLIKTIDGILNGSIKRLAQDNAESSYVSVINKSDAIIDWSKTAEQIHNLVRGLYPYPKAITHYLGKQLKIEKTKTTSQKTDAIPGSVVAVDKKSFCVSCGQNTVIEVLQVQPEGKKSMPVSAYILGNSLELNSKFGDD